MACLTPYQVRNQKKITIQDLHWIPVPCGKCPDCLERRKENWCFRLKKQEEVSASALFITLTYDNKHVPRSKNGFLTLDKAHFQNFMKALRRNTQLNVKISYYAVGEYGSTTHRPHYHAIIFNALEADIRKSWIHGHIDVGSFSTGSVSYVASYINKGRLVPAHPRDDRAKEFALMSKKMGINYLTPAVIDYHKADLNRNYLTYEGGYKKPLPRYFRNKIYSEAERDQQATLLLTKHAEIEAKKFKDYRSSNGSSDGYTQYKHEQLAARLAVYKQRERLKRDTL